MGILREEKVVVSDIRIRKDDCNVTFAKHGNDSAYLSLSMSQEEALKYKVDAEYVIQLRDVEKSLEPRTIEHKE